MLLSCREDSSDCLFLGRLTPSLLSTLLLLLVVGACSGAVSRLVAQEAVATWADIPAW